MVDKIACFLTCGYTEAGAMQFFLRKMNDKYDYRQFLPNKTIKKKGDAKSIASDINGLTGEALLEKVCSIIEKHREEIAGCKAVLLEDDLDGRFFGFDEEQIQSYNQKIITKIYEKLGMEMPVFILYASPEAESWFIADWKNGFEYLYCYSGIVDDMGKNIRLFFSHHLRKYIENNILKEHTDSIEQYGWSNGEYTKLSDKIIDAVQTGVKEYIQEIPNVNDDYAKQILESKKLYYSKKLHGDRMLRNIQPALVAEKCKTYFGNTYNEIADF